MPIASRSAALYMRASSEHQNYSTSHQEGALRDHAAANGLNIVAIYRDEGRSGLTLAGRGGLTKLLRDVLLPDPPFRHILIYDVSRWGRFQDADEAAHYEFVCRHAGMAVDYCAEEFANDGSPIASIMKAMKRNMAAEYSRELSVKVKRAQINLSRAGFKQGGSAGYGLRRQSVSGVGAPGRLLEHGERKNMPTDRVTYVFGPQEEVDIVRRIYAMYIDQSMADCSIASALNAEKVPHPAGRWSDFHIKNVLTNPKYAGTLVYNRSTQLMKSTRRPTDRTQWIMVPDNFPAIVTQARFNACQAERDRRHHRWSDNELLGGLRAVLASGAAVTYESLDTSDVVPCAKTYIYRFGSFTEALRAAGIEADDISPATTAHFKLRFAVADITREFERCLLAATTDFERLTCRTYRIGNVMVRVLCTRCRTERRHPCWKVTLTYAVPVDFIIWARMENDNITVAQLYLIPVAAFAPKQFLWPSSCALERYVPFAMPSMAAIFGLSDSSTAAVAPETAATK